MAQLLVQDNSNLWLTLDLVLDVYRLSLSAPQGNAGTQTQGARDRLRTTIVEADRLEGLSRSGALLLRSSGAHDAAESADSAAATASTDGWAVLAGAETRLRINGASVPAGIGALRDRDELSLEGGAPVYFSTERLASIETYRAEDSPRCPRCTLSIEAGDPSVCCPGCGVIYHQRPDRECWSYSSTCALCPQSSDLSAGYRWSPEDL